MVADFFWFKTLGLSAIAINSSFIRSRSQYRTLVYAYAPIVACIHKSTSLSPPQPFIFTWFLNFYKSVEKQVKKFAK